ncbi:hypothetical protein [Aeromonas veronii]
MWSIRANVEQKALSQAEYQQLDQLWLLVLVHRASPKEVSAGVWPHPAGHQWASVW